MNTTKKIYSKVLVMLLVVCASSVIQAQPQGGRPSGNNQQAPEIPTTKQIEKMVDELASEIDLEDTQEKQVLSLYLIHFEEVEEKTSGNSRPERSEMEALKNSFENEVKELLNDEQVTKYEAYIETQNENRRRH